MYLYTFVLNNGGMETVRACSLQEAVAAIVEYTGGEIKFELVKIREEEKAND